MASEGSHSPTTSTGSIPRACCGQELLSSLRHRAVGLKRSCTGGAHNCEVRRRGQHKTCTGILYRGSAGALPADRHSHQAAASCLEETNVVSSAQL